MELEFKPRTDKLLAKVFTLLYYNFTHFGLSVFLQIRALGRWGECLFTIYSTY